MVNDVQRPQILNVNEQGNSPFVLRVLSRRSHGV